MNKKELIHQIFSKETFLCVGLDTDMNKIPTHLLASDDPIYDFNRAIIDATAPYTIAYKPNLAFYEMYGAKGLQSFEKTVEYLKTNYPTQFIIADAKRGDIGNTSAMYARTFFDLYNVDAVTIAPYMGEDSVTPFLGRQDKWVILLALTSNRGATDFQTIIASNAQPLYETVIRKSQEWASDENMMYVVGATRGEMFKDIRRIAPNHFLLVPGIGAQGGTLDDVCRYGMNADCGLIVNNSRGIIYASNGDDYAKAAAEKAREIQQEMARALSQR
ncbi:MAG: orotidine-5'-phosphate decarboxylase [Prevotella sp.]|nr:orotidine-5'-phosphate decarboxylase [Prevotella sp.]